MKTLKSVTVHQGNILSVSLPMMGRYKKGGIQNRTVPDICSFAKQKKSITIKETGDSNECLFRAPAVGVALVKKGSGRYKHLSLVESQTAEQSHFLIAWNVSMAMTVTVYPETDSPWMI